jgi:hypothetical protein
MTDDLIARLRRANSELIACGNDFSNPLLDAADEIERLRAELKRIIDSDDTSSGRQREALRERAERAEARVTELMEAS